MSISSSLIKTIVAIAILCPLNSWAGENPPYKMIEMAYFKCEASRNLEGGIYGKGPLKRFGPEESACTQKQWVRISREEFKGLATQWYGQDWDSEIPWWNLDVKPNSEPNSSSGFEDQVGKVVTLKGRAENAKLGAILVGEDFSVWIDGLDRWPEEFFQGGGWRRVKVTGTVIEKYDLPVFIPQENDLMITGMPVPKGTDLHEASRRYLLKDSTWEIIDDAK